MKNRKVLVLLILFRSVLVEGQWNSAGVESASLGGISSVLENPWSTVENPAGLAGFSHVSFNTYLEQRYLATEIGNYALATTYPVRSGTFGFCTTYEGFQSFSCSRFTLAYGQSFAKVVSAGVSLAYSLQSAGNEARAIHMVGFCLGMQVKISDRLSMAFMAFNPFLAYYKSQPYAIMPSIYRIGTAYRPSPVLAILAEIEKDLDYKPVFRIGCEYSIKNEFFLRGGIQMLPFSYSLGAAFMLRKLWIGLATSYHQYLGFTPSTSLQYIAK
jgi:hypothetical protein